MSQSALLSRYDSDRVLRAQVTEMYLNNRSGFIASLIKLAYSLGASRPEAVEFANTVTRRVKAMVTPITPVRCYGCNRMFEPYANEWFCSDECHDAYPDEWPKTRSL